MVKLVQVYQHMTLVNLGFDIGGVVKGEDSLISDGANVVGASKMKAGIDG